jgi:primosomal protein N' (replication factor Y)
MPVRLKGRFAQVVIPSALRQTFTYRVDESLAGLEPGTRVWVPFGRGKRHGYVVGFTDDEPGRALKNVLRAEPQERLFSEEVLALTRWVADYYLAPWGQVLDAALPPLVRKSGSKRSRAPRTGRNGAEHPAGNGEQPTPAAAPSSAIPPAATLPAELASGELTNATLAPVAGHAVVITPAQSNAIEKAREAIRSKQFAAFLLQGVTGSGKTEVYLRLAEEVVRGGGQVLFLVPEIGLSTQILSRVQARFPEGAALYHSESGEGARRDVWREAGAGRLPIVVGARSAVFIPMPRLRLVVIDEEHEAAYKQDETPRYHGRDVAVYRAQRAGATVVLGSATPSLESRANVESGKYTLLSLPERIDARPVARVHLVDMAEVARELNPEPGKRVRPPIFSPYLLRAIQDRLDLEEQVILFLNRRGQYTAVQCGGCGASVQCKQCDVVLTYHRQGDHLRCHYCNAVTPPPRACDSCAGTYFHYTGFGTQRIEEELREVFPTARVERMDRDTTRRRGAHAQLVQAMEDREIDILLGTQMVAKGFDFPRVTLVGVLHADQEMLLPDFRAAERGFQILTQVAGRSGRGGSPGEVIFQTLMADHYVIQSAAAQDYDRFAAQEIVHRQELEYPPFRRMLHLLVDGPVEAQVEERAEALRVLLVAEEKRLRGKVQVLGPAPMPISRLKGQFRWHLSLLARSREALHRLGSLALDTPPPAGLSRTRVVADVDPVSMV